jgi:hypothetical protein
MPWKARHLALLAALPLVLGIASADKPAPPRGTPEQAQTITDLRNVGTAMYAWYHAEMEPRRSEEGHKAQKKAAEDPQADITTIPVISRDELAKVLVPKYIQAIPENDGWGHPYEYRLNTQDPNALHVMALRSEGSDGQFSGDRYEVGGFADTETAQDLAWMDGYFIRWPEPPKP